MYDSNTAQTMMLMQTLGQTNSGVGTNQQMIQL